MRIPHHIFDIGLVNDLAAVAVDAAARDVVGVVLRDEETYRAPLIFKVENHGAVAFVLNLLHSNNNNYDDPNIAGGADAYAAIQMRYQTALVSTITVQPGGVAVATIESVLKPYLMFRLNTNQGLTAKGRLTLVHLLGEVSARDRTVVP